jgi:hypothetical protein
LLIEYDDETVTDASHVPALREMIETTAGPIILSGRERQRSRHRTIASFDIPRPSSAEQRGIWHEVLGQMAVDMNGTIDQLTSQFALSVPGIRGAYAQAAGGADGDIHSDEVADILWDACRAQARPRLDDLALRIEPSAGWDDLVLPDEQKRTMHQIAAQLRQRMLVYERWGFAAKSSRGLGISALFAGASGTGKTMAAEVLAGELKLDLYRVDLSQVVSKYIGETEKNLERIFDAAEQGGAILLFDEADALFGKRSEVKDSRDRYANIEVSFLLQRMEAYRGLAILTTNQKKALDTAFLRRLRFVVEFPFPDAAQRAEIWRRIFPEATPVNELDYLMLSRLNIAGGNIRTIALNAAFIAADQNEAVGMRHLLHAARTEYAKLEKPLTDGEIRGWQ